jgi:hypothetical protein
MADKNNGWPIITQIFQQAKPEPSGGFATAVKWIMIGTLFLFTLRCIGEWF